MNFKARGNPTVSVVACNVLYLAYIDEEHWPQQFVEVKGRVKRSSRHALHFEFILSAF